MQLSFSSFLTFSFQEAGDSFCSGLGGSEVAEAGWIRSSEAELAWKNSEHLGGHWITSRAKALPRALQGKLRLQKSYF